MNAEEKPFALYQVRNRRDRLPGAGEALERLRKVPVAWTPSRFNVVVDLPDGLKAVYNTFSSALAVLPVGVWERLLAPGRRYDGTLDAAPFSIDALHDRGFLVFAGVDEIQLLRLHFQHMRHDRARRITVNVLPTLGCNLQCPYCFEGMLQANKHSRTMTRETEDALVAFLGRTIEGSRGLTISWFGGEPLLSVKGILRLGPRLVKVCEDAGLAYSSVLTTNGVLLSEEVVARLEEARVSILQVTVDVPDDTKRDKKGRDTQGIVLDNLVAAAERMQVHLRINLTRDDPEAWDRLYRGLVGRGLGRTLKSINIANVYQPEHARCDGVRSCVTHEDYVDVVARQRARARELGLPTHTSLSWQRPAGCAATAETAFTIDPDGFVYRCPEDAGWPERAYGTVFMDGPTHPGNSVPWLAYDWFSHANCRDCAVLPQCAGGCPHRRMFQPDLDPDDYCYWFLRGGLEERIRELAMNVRAAG